jgi:hypothetical protein
VGDEADLADRLRIVQKVKECYGLGVKTSLERVMRKGSDVEEPLLTPTGKKNKEVASHSPKIHIWQQLVPQRVQ